MGKSRGRGRGGGAAGGQPQQNSPQQQAQPSPASSPSNPKPVPVSAAQSSPPKQPTPERSRSPKAFAVQQVTEGVAALQVESNVPEQSREDVMAARKAKSAAKADKAAKAAAKKAAEEGATQTAAPAQNNKPVTNAQPVDGAEHNRDDVVAARKAKAAAKAEKAAKAQAKKAAEAGGGGTVRGTAAQPAENEAPAADAAAAARERARQQAIAQRAEKAAKQQAANAQTNSEVKGEGSMGGGGGKSNLKQGGGGQSAPTEKGVRFGVARTQSEENLMIAIKHAEEANTKIPSPSPETRDLLHPALLPLFDKCENGELDSLDELCLHFYECVKEFIAQFTETYRKTWTHEEGAESQLGSMMDGSLRAQLNHLTQNNRFPLPYALGGLVKHLLREMAKVGVTDELTGRAMPMADLLSFVDDEVKRNFDLANVAISNHLSGKIAAASKIVTYDWCPVVNRVLIDSVTRGALRQLSIIDAVKDGPGMRHLFSLSDFRGYVEYGDLTAIGSVFTQGSLLLLGCSAVLSSGRVALARGAVQLAIVARAANVPVLVLAPTYKFVDKAQSSPRLSFLGRSSLDILPPDLITAIVTDIRLLPPSSAPAVLKARALDDA